MGKTNPTYRQLLDEWINSWEHFHHGLRHPWSEDFRILMDGAKQHADAAIYSNPAGPQEIAEHAIISICLQQQIRIRELEERIENPDNVTEEA